MSPFEVTIEKITFLLNFYGITINKKTVKKKKIIYRWVFIFNFFWMNSDTLGGLLVVFNGLTTDEGFVEVTYMAPCSTLTFMSTIKTILFIYYEDKIYELAANLKELDQEYNVNRPEIQSDIYFVNTVLKASKVLNAMLWSIFSFSPLVVSCIFYAQSGVFEVIFPCLILYPFDSRHPMIWPFVYFHQIVSVYIVLLNMQGPDYFLYICCTYLRIQFRLLCFDLKKTVNDNRFLPHKSFEKKCMPLIQRHQKLIMIASNLEFVYTKSTLIHFLAASFLICLTGFNVVMMAQSYANISNHIRIIELLIITCIQTKPRAQEIMNPGVTMMFLVFLSTNLAQIFLICYLGDLLMKSTMEVSEALYDTKWYDIDTTGRKNLLLVHFRAQKPCKLTAFGFSDVSLKSFTSILSTAWSYFALLKSISSPTKT